MKRFAYLKMRLAEYGIDRPYLARELDVSPGCIKARMTGESEWDLDEQYKIMDMIHEPYTRMHIVFPKNGEDKPERTMEDITLGEFMSRILAASAK